MVLRIFSINIAACLPDGRQVQEAVSDAEGAGDRVVDARVEEARQRRQDSAKVLCGDREVKKSNIIFFES